MVKPRIVIAATMILVALGSLFIWQALQIGKFRLIACDVGQGDALLLITPGGQQMLVDGGPNYKVIDCLARYMPFWDRKIEIVVNTHPDQDHLQGLPEVLKLYEVDLLVKTPITHKTELFKTWQKKVTTAKISTYNPVAGDILKLGGVNIEVVWPTREEVESWKAQPPSEINDTSVILRVNAGNGDTCVYLTGDVSFEILEQVVDKPCSVLKVAHHGSRTGTSVQMLELVRPKIALLDVGFKNRYRHPHKEVLDMLSKVGATVYRTDNQGDIELVFEKNQWIITTAR